MVLFDAPKRQKYGSTAVFWRTNLECCSNAYMIEMGRNMSELECKAKELKEKYFEKVFANYLERNRELERIILDTQRLLGKNSYTDKEIQKKASSYQLPEEARDYIARNFDPANMSNGSDTTVTGHSIEKLCGDMRGLDVEMLRFLMFDESGNYIGKVEALGKESHVGQEAIEEVWNLLKDYPKCRKVITIHNHPHNVCALTNENDDRTAAAFRTKFNKMGIEMIGDYIISELDLFCRDMKKDAI